MKRFCLLITSFLVNISAENEPMYNEVVFLTNTAFKLAYDKNDLVVGDNSRANGLEHIIEKMVNNEDNFGQINFMIVTPDNIDVVFNTRRFAVFDPAIAYTYYQSSMLQETLTTLKIKIPDVDLDQDFGLLNLTTLGHQRRCLVKPALKNIFSRVLGSKYYQLLVKLEGRDKLGSNMTALVEWRKLTGKSFENTIRRRVFDGPVHDVSVSTLCRLLGLYMSTQFPLSYIKDILIDTIDNTCTLDDGITQKIFKKINDEWWQISPENDTVRLLDEQLR